MALTPALRFTQDADNIEIGVVEDITADYGDGGNQAREDAANFLLWSKTDKDGNRTFDNPNFGNELSIMQWQVNTPKDGYYEAIWMRIQLYDAAANYVEQQQSGSTITQHASAFYYPSTDKVYKAIAPSQGQNPTNTNFFQEVTDLSTLIGNTNVETFIIETGQTNTKGVYVRTRASRAASILMGRLDDETCPSPSAKDREKAYLIDSLIQSADAEFAQGNPREMEKIMRYIERKTASLFA